MTPESISAGELHSANHRPVVSAVETYGTLPLDFEHGECSEDKQLVISAGLLSLGPLAQPKLL